MWHCDDQRVANLPVLSRLTRTDPDGQGPSRPVLVTAAIAALWCVVMGFVIIVVPVLLGWAFSAGPSSAFSQALATTVHVWIAAHHVPLVVGGATFSFLPLALLALPIILLFQAGKWAARAQGPATTSDAVLLTTAIAVIFGLINIVLNAWASSGSISSSAWRVFLASIVLAWVCAGSAICREMGIWERVFQSLPESVKVLTAATAAGLLTLVALSAVLAALALIIHFGEVCDSFTLLGTGFVGTILLVVICLAYIPNVLIWVASFALGPGFALGTGTTVSAAVSQTSALPVFPLVAAVPTIGTPPVAAAVVLVFPLVAAVVTGWWIAKTERSPESSAAWAGAAGLLLAVVLGFLAWLSGGSIGSGRLSEVGPHALSVALFASLILTLVSAASAWSLSMFRARTASSTRP